MSIKEQKQLKEEAFHEAMRYMENAKDVLKKANKHDNIYNDKKYVKMACGTAYNAVLIALDTYVKLKSNIVYSEKDRKSIDFYRKNIATVDKKLLGQLNIAYEVLHLLGYYDGITSVKVLHEGFESANHIINKIKPIAN